MATALDLVDDAIADLQARLNLNPSSTKQPSAPGTNANANANVKPKTGGKKNNQEKGGGGGGGGKPKQPKQQPQKAAEPPEDQPDICKLEFKVGVITKVWLQYVPTSFQ